MNTVKVYYSTTDYHPPYRVDIVELFCHCMPKMGIEVEWYMARAQQGGCEMVYFAGQKVNLPKRLKSSGLLAKIFNKIFYWLCDILGLLKCLFKPLDLIHVRDKYFAALVGLLVARIKGIKFIYWCSYPFPEHDLECVRIEKGVNRYFYLVRGWFGNLTLYRLVMKYGDHVFVQSEQMKLDITQYGVAPEKMTSVPMGVPQRLLDWATTHPVRVVQCRVVYLGTMATVRRLHVLIDAFATVRLRCPQATLVMVGDGDLSHERPALEQQVAALGLSDAVTFTGFVPIEEAWSFAASAAVCVSPFFPTKVLASTSPTKLVEYMAIGRPVVCNDHPEQSEIIRESGAGTCVAWGANEFADAIVWMLENPQEAELMGAQGPAWVEANRTYPIITEKVWQRYQSILGLSA